MRIDKSASRAKKGLLRTIKQHPVRTVGVAAGTVIGIALLRKAASTAAKVVTIKAVAGAASEVAGAVRSGGSRTRSRTSGAKRAVAKKATAKKA